LAREARHMPRGASGKQVQARSARMGGKGQDAARCSEGRGLWGHRGTETKMQSWMFGGMGGAPDGSLHPFGDGFRFLGQQ